MLDPDLQARIERRLDKGERLVWYAKPRPSAWFPQCPIMVLFGLIWCCATGVIVWGAQNASGMPGVSRLVLLGREITSAQSLPARLLNIAHELPFIAIGLATLLAPLWHWLWSAQLAYAVTNQRALYIGRLGTRTFRAAELFVPDRADHHNGLSDILFCREIVCMNRRHGLTDSRLIGFRNLPAAEAPAAEAALRALYDQAHPASPLPQRKPRIKPR